MFFTTILNTLFLAFSVAAVNAVLVERSPITLPISRRTNFTSARNLLLHDQARAKFLKSQGAARSDASAHGGSVSERVVISEPVENQGVTYVASVGVGSGSPPTYYSLLIDTGSSNTWVGAGEPYVETTMSVKTKDKMRVTYGSGSVSGIEYIDRVTLTSDLVIPNQSIGVAGFSEGLDGLDGILGIGPGGLTVGTLDPDTDAEIPTVTDNLFANGDISANQIAISFAPYNGQDTKNGEIIWGGTDDSKFTGSITYIPITSTSPASAFWGIDQSIRYGESTTILTTTSGIVDTGTTLILIASKGFHEYQRATHATYDFNTDLLTLTADRFKQLKSLFFIAGGTTFELIPNAQIWPRALNTDIGGTASGIYLIIADIGSDSEGLGFINGFAFLERFYSVFDTGNQRVGLANTPFTKATTN